MLADLVPAIHRDCGWLAPIAVAGRASALYKAVDLCLRRPDVFPVALGMSGVYDLDRIGWGERGDTFYFHNPADYVAGMSGRPPRLDPRHGAGSARGRHRDVGGRLGERRPQRTLRFARVLAEKGIPHELDVWGERHPARLALLGPDARQAPSPAGLSASRTMLWAADGR